MTEASGSSRKGPAAFRTISEASAELGVAQHVLRFWETKFAFIRPMKRAGGRRFYRPQDLDVLKGVRALLQEEGYTIKGVQKLHREQGLKRLVAASGVGDDAAARVAAQVEAEAAAGEAAGAVAGDAELSSASTAAEAPVWEASLEPEDAEPGQSPAAPAGGTSEIALRSDPPSEEASPPRPVLDAVARRRLAEVLGDLETTKAAIDALLQES